MVKNDNINQKVVTSTMEKCANCGGNLIFYPDKQGLKCENCGSIFDIQKSTDYNRHNIDEQTKDSTEYKNWVANNKIFKCKNCGSSVILNSLEISKRCPYCDTAFVMASDEIPTYSPDSIIPFSFDAEEASNRFIQNVKKKFYVSGKFKKKLPKNQIKGTYIPTFNFDAETNSDYNGVLTKTRTVHDHRNNTSRTVTETFPIAGNIKMSHKNISIETSSKISQENLNGILPYNYNGVVAYKDDYIRGYTVEHYQDALHTCEEIAKQVYRDQIKKGILARYPQADGVQYLNFTPTISNEKYQYQLVPLYKFQYKYKKKDYITYMNGQTGKIDNNLPKSIPKIVGTVILIILIIALPIILSLISD